MYKGMFTINFSDDELYYFNLLNQDLTILLKSEKYETYAECLDVINQVKEIGKNKSSYFKKVSDSNLYYFIIISPLGMIVATSMFFIKEKERDLLIDEVMEISQYAHIYENFD